MPGDLAIDGLTQASYPPASSHSSASSHSQASSHPAGAAYSSELARTGGSATFSAQAAVPATAAKTAQVELASPRLHTDLALNRLVLEFFDSQGDLTQSIPNQKQLDAYRLAASSGAKGTVDP